jgi:threonine dehydrogenase-like Zn-dependent dehydrogenase
VTIDAVGNASSLEMATRVTEHHGRIHLLGAAAVLEVDLSAVWFRELELIGSFSHSQDSGTHSFDRAIGLIAAARFPPEIVVSHRFPLTRIEEAFSTAHSRSSGALKVVLEP